jgi:hypothetical protein
MVFMMAAITGVIVSLAFVNFSRLRTDVYSIQAVPIASRAMNLPFESSFLSVVEQAEKHQTQTDQQEQPVFGRVIYEQCIQVSARLVFGDNLGVRLPDQHPYFKQNGDEAHITAAADIGIVQVLVFIFAQFFKTEYTRHETQDFFHMETPLLLIQFYNIILFRKKLYALARD